MTENRTLTNPKKSLDVSKRRVRVCDRPSVARFGPTYQNSEAMACVLELGF